MRYSTVIFSFGTRSSDELKSLRNGESLWAELFEDIFSVVPSDNYSTHVGEDKKSHDLRPVVAKRGSTHIIYVPSRGYVFKKEAWHARGRVMNYLPSSKFTIAIGFIGGHHLSYEHGHAILPYRAINSDKLREYLKKEFEEESHGGYADRETQNDLYALCKSQNLSAHLVDTTFSVRDENETFQYNSRRLFEMGYAGRDMELAWFLSFVNRYSIPVGTIQIVSDTVRLDETHENPFGDVSKGQEVFSVPEIAKENARKALYVATLHALNRS